MKTILSKNSIRRLTPDLPFYLLSALLLFGIKYFYSGAGSDALKWILAPTTKWVTLLSGIPFVYEKGTGYVNHSLRLLIAPSCSGVQFMLITFAVLVFSFLHRIGDTNLTPEPLSETDVKPVLDSSRGCRFRALDTLCCFHPAWKKLLWVAASLLLSYVLTILVNGLRIIAAIYLPIYFEETPFLRELLSPEKLHTAIGIVVYFVSLLIVYHLAEYAFQKRDRKGRDGASPLKPFLRKCLAPAFWYLFIVLGIPFLNKAYRKSGAQFTDFALLVAGCCSIILLLYALSVLAWKGFHRRLDSPEQTAERQDI